MLCKKHFLLILILFLVFVPFVLSFPPLTSVDLETDSLRLLTNVKEYHKTDENYTFNVHVFNATTGYPITSGVTCYLQIDGINGKSIISQMTNTTENIFDYSFNVSGDYFNDRGYYQVKTQCNNSNVGGASLSEFVINDYGEELTQGESFSFNFSMLFLFFLFILSLIGMFTIENYIAKFTFYWICHVLFVVGTFSLWQFNQGFAIGYVGLSGVYKVLFYVSITALFPMVLVSIAWIVYLHAFNEHMQKMLDKGESPETAFQLTKRKKKGWFYGS